MSGKPDTKGGEGTGPATRGRRCPICGRPEVQRFRPFCSARCADVDLGRWFSGRYRVPSAERPEEAPPGDETDQD